MCKQAVVPAGLVRRLRRWAKKRYRYVCICHGPPCAAPCWPTGMPRPRPRRHKKKRPATKTCLCTCPELLEGPPCRLPCEPPEGFPPLPYEMSIQIHYLPSEVILHNKPPDDCWVSIFDRVINISSVLLQHWETKKARVLAAYAGKDISHFFDRRTYDIKRRIQPVTGVRVAYTPHGPMPHTWPHVPTSDWKPPPNIPWWLDPDYEVGLLTRNPRPLRIINMFIGVTTFLTVCEEDTINRIRERYMPFNSNALRYIWKVRGKQLDMNKTLDQNGIPDDRQAFLDVFMREDFYIPSVQVFFKDAT